MKNEVYRFFLYISNSKIILLDRFFNMIIPVDIDNFIVKRINSVKGNCILITGSFSKIPKEIGNCYSLTSLNLTNKRIIDISTLSNLTSLKTLSLYCNQIVDISSIYNLTSLERLWLSDNKIVDISILYNLTYLKELSLSYNRIVDISALSNLTSLRYLSINDNKIKNMIKFNSKIIIYQ